MWELIGLFSQTIYYTADHESSIFQFMNTKWKSYKGHSKEKSLRIPVMPEPMRIEKT